MRSGLSTLVLFASLCLGVSTAAWAGQQASATGLEPKQPYILALSHERDGQGPLEPLAAFMTNPAGSAIVNATGAIRQVVHGEDRIQRRYLVIAEGHADKPGHVVQAQLK
jgi:hypothetical protein